MPETLTEDSIIKLAEEFSLFFKCKYKDRFGTNLRGSCGLASWAFQELISKFNGEIETYWGLCQGTCHCWNKIDDKIIDLTYQQLSRTAKLPFVTKNIEIYLPKCKVEDPSFFELWETWPLIANTSKLINEFLNDGKYENISYT